MRYRNIEERIKDVKEATDGINLDEKEEKFLKWLVGWDTETVDNFISILNKVKERV